MLDYGKSGKQATTKKLLDKINYSVKEKYGFNPISVIKPVVSDELKNYVQDLVDQDVRIDEIEEVIADLIEESIQRLDNKFGRVPSSVENFTIPKEYKEFTNDDSIVKRVTLNDGIAKAHGGGFAAKYNYSTFNPALADFILMQYFTPESTIFDPFCGTAVKGLLANKNKINFHGWDVSGLTLKINENKIQELEDEMHPMYQPDYEIKYNLGDGTKLEGVAPNTYDGCFTCPPYFNIEKYENVEGQLTNHKKYAEFLSHYREGFKRYAEVIKPTTSIDDFHPLVIVTGNIRINNQLIDFTGDTRQIAKEHGFELYDEIHHQNNSPFAYLRSRQNEARKMVQKVHETVSVFIKKGEGIKKI